MIKQCASILLLFSCSAWAESHHPQEFLQSIRGKADEGGKIVEKFCSTCHDPSPLIALGAPRMGNDHDWEPRLKQGKQDLIDHTLNGLNAMPPRGGCFECSDEQLILAISSMIPKIDQSDLIEELKVYNKNN